MGGYVNKNFGPWGQAIYPLATNFLLWLFPPSVSLVYLGFQSFAYTPIWDVKPPWEKMGISDKTKKIKNFL